MIPSFISQIWLGPRPMPEEWMSTWALKNPEFGYRVWGEEALANFGLVNEELYLRCLDEELYDTAADVARVEILYRHGGVYVDADSKCKRTIVEAPFMEAGFFAVHEPTPLAHGLVTNAFIGARPGHPVLFRYIQALKQIPLDADLRPSWEITGPVLLTRMIADGEESDVQILPAWMFLARTLRGKPITGGKGYAVHFFSSTAERNYRFQGAKRYPV